MKKNYIILLLVTIVVLLSIYLYTHYIQLTINEIKSRIVHQIDSVASVTKTPQPVFEKNCLFDIDAQTDDFLKGKPELQNYTWNKNTKTATIVLSNNDTLFVERGGCQNFNFYITLHTSDNQLNIKNPQQIYNKALQIAGFVFDVADQSTFQYAIATGTYEKTTYPNTIKLSFNFPDKCIAELLFIADKKHQRNTLKIGYTLCQ